MSESGRSSAGDYDISHPVVESIVARLLEHPNVLGARMMGGGEGGSLIAIVSNGADAAVQQNIAAITNQDLPTGAAARQVFAFEFAEGASIVPVA